MIVCVIKVLVRQNYYLQTVTGQKIMKMISVIHDTDN